MLRVSETFTKRRGPFFETFILSTDGETIRSFPGVEMFDMVEEKEKGVVWERKATRVVRRIDDVGETPQPPIFAKLGVRTLLVNHRQFCPKLLVVISFCQCEHLDFGT